MRLIRSSEGPACKPAISKAAWGNHNASQAVQLTVLMTMHNPAHPGDVLREWLEGTQVSITAFAAHIGVTRAKLSRIINGRSGVTAEFDLRLNQAFGTREGLWLDLQAQRDLWVAKQVKAPRIERLIIREGRNACSPALS
jgi:addiction module HigA family antidote